MTDITATITRWYEEHARELPWRNSQVTAWGILVSEFMLQQTQVDRVIPRWRDWMQRWPTPADLAAAPVQDAIVAWDRLGYPRRALWLHRTATIITERYGGIVPRDVEELLTLPGVGDYTARAVAVFAYAERHPVVDTNIRRVVARIRNGQADQAPPNIRRDLAEMEEFLPDSNEGVRLANYAIMEFGAVVCTARAPGCAVCPVRDRCAWALAGFPEFVGKRAKGQPKFEGSDRQVRGQIMAILRAAVADVPRRATGQGLTFALPTSVLLDGQVDTAQAERALVSLVRDGLVVEEGGLFRLP